MITSKLEEISRDVKDLKRIESSRAREKSSSHKIESFKQIEDYSLHPADARTPGCKKPRGSATGLALAAETSRQAGPKRAVREAAAQTPAEQLAELTPVEEQPREAANDTLNTAQFPAAGAGSMEKISSGKRSSEAAKFVSSQTIKKVSLGTLGGPSSGQFGAPVTSLPFHDPSHSSAFRPSRHNTDTPRDNPLFWDHKMFRQ